MSCKKILFSKIIQMFTDLAFLCLGVSSLVATIVVSAIGLKDPRLTLGQACLESDTAGFVRVVITWGISLGAMVTVTSALGVYSCCRQRVALLICYSMLGYVLTLLELFFFLTVYIHLGRVTQTTEQCLQDVLVRYYTGPFRSSAFNFSGAWDHLHRQHRCCGVGGGSLFNSMLRWNRTWLDRFEDDFFNTSSLQLEEFRIITVLPYTCCVYRDEKADGAYNPDATVDDVAELLLDRDCPFKPTSHNSYTRVGCFQLVQRFVLQVTALVFRLSLPAELLQLAAAIAALYTARATANTRLKDAMVASKLM